MSPATRPTNSGFLRLAALAVVLVFGQFSHAAAQVCQVATDAIGGGTVIATGQSGGGVDTELSIDIASDLSYVRLENSAIRVEYQGFDVRDGNGDFQNRQYAIKSWVIKSTGTDQLKASSRFDYLGAGAGIENIQSAELIYDGADRKTVRMTWSRWNVSNQVVDPTRTIVREISIFPNAQVLQVDFVDIRYAINLADLLRPGGSTNGEHVAHGGDEAPRGYLSHDEPPGVFYSRYAPDGVNDPADGGVLNYNGSFVTAVYNPGNGQGFGRVMPVQHTHVIKLLLNPGNRRGLEFQNYPFLKPVPPFTGYMYTFTGGATEALDVGRALVDEGIGGGSSGFECGEPMNITAYPYTGWNFTGWSGDASGVANPLSFTPVTNSSVTGNFALASGLYVEDFDGFGAGENPPGWIDTQPNNSLLPDDALFATQTDADGTYFATNSTETNIHSHLGTNFGSGYSYTGRMRMTNAVGGMGVTFFSQFPTSAGYYRLRRFGNNQFEISPTGTSVSGNVNTGVFAEVNKWYRFAIEVEDTGSQTDIRAKVWLDGTAEPPDWQAEAYDDSPGRFTSGTVGVWSFNSGSKHFDELSVRGLTTSVPTVPINTSVVGNGTVQKNPDQALYVEGSSVQLTAVPDAGWQFVDWTGDISSTSNPVNVIATAPSVDVTANFQPVTQHPIVVNIVGQGTVDLDPDQAMYDLGSVVTATATADPGWQFDGWSGDITSTNNPLDITVTGDLNLTATFVEFTGVSEDFESYAAGANPTGWFDTDAGNSLSENDALFDVGSDGSNKYLNTSSTATNIHSHLTSLAPPAGGYRYGGRMRMTNNNGGIGVTFFSQFPSSVGYYRLRRYHSNAFHISPVGTSLSGGTTDTGVVPTANTWYRFLVEVEDTGTQTNIRAKVWQDGTAEPAGWQVDAFDSNPGRFTSGTVGVWSFTSGSKAFDDITIEPLGPPPTDLVLTVSTAGSGTVAVNPDQPEYTFNDVVELTATPDAGWQFGGWSGDISSSANPLNVVMTGDISVTANFFEPSAEYLEDFQSYAAGADPTDWDDTASGNSLTVVDLHEVVDLGGNKAFRTTSTQTNIHSHYVGVLPDPSAYEYTGRMQMTDAQGGVGVTFFSQFGSNAAYYRLRRYFSNSFHISPLGTSVTGTTDTGVVPVANQWYQFKVQVEDTGTQTEIRAKVWLDGDAEPASWQADAVDASGSRLTSGTIGVWSFHRGEKLWDDLRAIPLAGPQASVGAKTEGAGLDGSGLTEPEAELEFQLHTNYPNPLRESTTIRYTIPEAVHVNVSVYDALGQRVDVLVDAGQEAGTHSVTLNRGQLAAGVYFYRLEAGSNVATKHMVVVR